MKPFRFGLLAERFSSGQAWIDLACRAEQDGYATLLIRDHFMAEPFGNQLAPIAALTAAAMVTTKLRLGTIVIDNDYRHPAVLAKEISTLDLLSGGRVELGLGAGWLQAEYAQTGIPFDPPGERISRLQESVAILTGLLAGDEVRYEGEHYQICGLRNFPMPIQQPLPLLIGGGNPRVLRFAGKVANIVSLLTSSVVTGELVDDPQNRLSRSVRERIDWVREGAGERFPEIELSFIPTMVVTGDRVSGVRELISSNEWNNITAADVDDMPAVFVGNYEEIAVQMEQRRQEFGISYYMIADRQLEDARPLVAMLSGR